MMLKIYHKNLININKIKKIKKFFSIYRTKKYHHKKDLKIFFKI